MEKTSDLEDEGKLKLEEAEKELDFHCSVLGSEGVEATVLPLDPGECGPSRKQIG